MSLFLETRRKAVILSFLGLAFFLDRMPESWALFFALCGFIHNVFLLPRYAPQLFREKETLLQGLAVYPLMIALLIVLFPGQPELAVGAWAVMAIGDSAAAMVGRRFDETPLPWNPEKTLGGMVGFLGFATVGAALFMLWSSPAGTPFGHILLVTLGAAAAAAVYESLPLKVDDNITTAVVAAAFFALLWPLDLIVVGSEAGGTTWFYSILVNAFLSILAYQFRLVTITGVIGGIPIGVLILVHGGIPMFSLLFLFIAIASFATHFGYDQKAKYGLAQGRDGRRGARNAFANCLLALLAALWLGVTEGADPLFALFYTAALGAALSDTVATEMGLLYGTSPFLPTNFRLVSPGTPGAVSLEGTLFGFGASIGFAAMAWAFTVIPFAAMPVVILGSWFGFVMESYIRSVWVERDIAVNGNWMNLLNTFLGGTFALLIAVLCGAV
ncbi:MAG: DUF92 domain-containing protein [bacterium]|jgi:uncharacterized protein (TIGR00297 family)|nr:DUF92 domain-containing protein [bacterium]